MRIWIVLRTGTKVKKRRIHSLTIMKEEKNGNSRRIMNLLDFRHLCARFQTSLLNEDGVNSMILLGFGPIK